MTPTTTSTAHTPTYFGTLGGYICTANADGSIPLNSKVACPLGDAACDASTLLHQANAYPAMLEALQAMVQAMEALALPGDQEPGGTVWIELQCARSVIAQATGSKG